MDSDDLLLRKPIILVKVGGSSITNKAKEETLDEKALTWFSKIIASSISEEYLFKNLSERTEKEDKHSNKPSFIIVHGAGSFGHHCAKEFGLRGKTSPPRNLKSCEKQDRRRLMSGLARTRASVKALNNHVVKYLINSGINAVGISPCINIPGLHAHGGDEYGGVTTLLSSIKESLTVGLIPVVHGDAGLYGCLDELDKISAGILGGDTLVEVISSHDLLDISSCIFLTDVAGVYSKDPKLYPNDAKLISRIDIDASNGKVITKNIYASGSLHAHDVTGGLDTKLKSAAKVAMNGTEVIIAKCASESAEHIFKSMEENTSVPHSCHTIIKAINIRKEDKS